MSVPTDEEILSQSLDNQRTLLREFGPSLTLAAALTFFTVACKGPITQVEIAQFAGLSTSSVNRSMRFLAGKGLVLMEASPGDGRRKLVRLSAKGAKIAHTFSRRIMETRAAALKQCLD